MHYRFKKVFMEYNFFQRFIATIFFILIYSSSIFMVYGSEQNSIENMASQTFTNIYIKDGAKPYKQYQTSRDTIGKALSLLNISLNKYDKINVNLEDKVSEGIKIKIERVTFKKINKTYKIKFKTKKKKTSKLYIGQKKIKCKGQKGIKKVCYLRKYINGKIVKTTKTNTKIVRKPKTKVVLIGTKKKNAHMIAYNPTKVKTTSKGGAGAIYDNNGKKIAYTRKISGYATAYSYDAGSLTATGEKVHIGGVAVNPNQIPYGSRLYIESPNGKLVYGYARAIDTGGFAYNGSGTVVDLFYPSYNDCEQFGRRVMNIYILK